MKKLLLLLFLILSYSSMHGQNYPNIVNYYINGTPKYGAKIKTNIPTNVYTMPSINITGYSFGESKIISLNLVFYIYPTNNNIIYYSASSNGSVTPDLWLGFENGKIVIFMDSKVYYQRFTVSVYANGVSGDKAEYFQNWTVADELLSASYKVKVPYGNNFAGKVGIGTENPQTELDVAGTIRAREVKIEVNAGADHVFADDYQLRPLSEIEKFVEENKHLPGIPSEKQMQQEGLSINEFQIKLLQKIEELTLYCIRQNKQIEELKKQIGELENQ